LKVITVSRSYGSGGSQFARKLADRLGYQYVDEVFVQGIKKNPAQCSPVLCSIEDEVGPGFLDKIAGLMNNRSFYKTTFALCIYEAAVKNDLVLVGSGGHLILAGCPSLISLQVVRKLSDRVRAIADAKDLTAEDALKVVESKDKEKSHFVKDYFDKDLFDPLMYHLTINAGFFALDDAVELAAEHAGRFYASVDAVSSEQFLKDRLLEKKAEMALFHLGMTHSATTADFTADRGRLTIHGVVGGEHEKRQLIEALKKMSEVTEVIDNLKVGVLSRNVY
jgi:cytidylate kinase